MDKPTEEIINGQVDFKLGNLTEDELDTVRKKIKKRKEPRFLEILLKIWKEGKLMIYFFGWLVGWLDLMAYQPL